MKKRNELNPKSRFWILGTLLLCMSQWVAAQTLVEATPESAGMSSERLLRIDRVVQEYVDKKQVAGAVVLVARNGKIVYILLHNAVNA